MRCSEGEKGGSGNILKSEVGMRKWESWKWEGGMRKWEKRIGVSGLSTARRAWPVGSRLGGEKGGSGKSECGLRPIGVKTYAPVGSEKKGLRSED